MKNISILCFLLMLLTLTLRAQITITQADMPQPGDVFITTNALVDLSIARQYAGLVADEAVRTKIFKAIEDEFALTREMVLGVAGGGAMRASGPAR